MSRLQSVEKPSCPLSGNWVSITYTTENRQVLRAPLLLQCVTEPDPMLSMLEWLCIELMEAEVDQQLGAEKSQRTDGRSGYRSGYRPRRLDTRMGTMYLAGCVEKLIFQHD